MLRASTHDLPDVPPLVHAIVGAFLAPTMAWVKALVLRRVRCWRCRSSAWACALARSTRSTLARQAHLYQAVIITAGW